MKHGSLFSGIGGFDLAAEWMGWENVFHCELNPFCKKILSYYWPNSISYEDIITTDFSIWRGRIDIITGGFPCQPYSLAGARKGNNDNRHLWPEMLRAIREIKPKWIVGENVPGITSWNKGLVFEEIQNDLENQGYKVLSVSIPALGIGAAHLRERIWIVAYSGCMGWEDIQGNIDSSSYKIGNTERYHPENEWRKQKTNELDPSRNTFLQFEELYRKPPIFSMDDGLPFKLDGITISKWIQESITGAGNAIMPQVVFQIFEVIQKMNKTFNL